MAEASEGEARARKGLEEGGMPKPSCLPCLFWLCSSCVEPSCSCVFSAELPCSCASKPLLVCRVLMCLLMFSVAQAVFFLVCCSLGSVCSIMFCFEQNRPQRQTGREDRYHSLVSSSRRKTKEGGRQEDEEGREYHLCPCFSAAGSRCARRSRTIFMLGVEGGRIQILMHSASESILSKRSAQVRR